MSLACNPDLWSPIANSDLNVVTLEIILETAFYNYYMLPLMLRDYRNGVES